MNKVNKSVLVPHSAERMYELVDRVEDYPNFLPWCSRSEVLLRDGNVLEARIFMDYMKITHNFSTHNDNIIGKEINIHLLDGPFSHLNGTWKFMNLGSVGCKIDFTLEYSFTNSLLSKLLGPVFNFISNSLIEAFIQEANKRYGK